MALVPYSYQKAFSAEHSSDSCLIQIGCHSIQISQDHERSGSVQDLDHGRRDDRRSSKDGADSASGGSEGSDARFRNVGLRVWQCAFVLTEYLVRRAPLRQWAGVRVLDLGSGTGVTGICLALAGANTFLTDLPHITPLTRQNVNLNCKALVQGRATVLEHRWGEPACDELSEAKPDIITAADCIYQPEHYGALLLSIKALSQPHTITYLAYRRRGNHESDFFALLEESDFHVLQIPEEELHDEFRGGDYVVARATRI